MYQEQTQNETQHAVWLIQNNVQTTIKAQDQTAYITIIEKKIMTKMMMKSSASMYHCLFNGLQK